MILIKYFRNELCARYFSLKVKENNLDITP